MLYTYVVHITMEHAGCHTEMLAYVEEHNLADVHHHNIFVLLGCICDGAIYRLDGSKSGHCLLYTLTLPTILLV